MKIDNLDDLKNFIIWARNNKIKKIKVQDMEFEISDLAFIESIGSVQEPSIAKEDSTSQLNNEDDEDLLFYSSQTS